MMDTHAANRMPHLRLGQHAGAPVAVHRPQAVKGGGEQVQVAVNGAAGFDRRGGRLGGLVGGGLQQLWGGRGQEQQQQQQQDR